MVPDDMQSARPPGLELRILLLGLVTFLPLRLLGGTVTFPFDFEVSGTSTSAFQFPIVDFQSSGSGFVSVVDDVQYASAGRINLLMVNPDGSYVSTGTFTFAGLNGNDLFGTYLGESFNPNQFGSEMFNPTYTITGGTGIFYGATGGAEAKGTTSFITGAFTISGSGNVTVYTAEPSPFLPCGLALAGLSFAALTRLRHFCAQK